MLMYVVVSGRLESESGQLLRYQKSMEVEGQSTGSRIHPAVSSLGSARRKDGLLTWH
jgi:hypothetical protein